MRHLILILSAFLVIAGCSSNKDKVQDAILSYANTVATFYSQGMLNEDESFVDQKQLELLKQQVQDFAQMQIRLHPSLRSIRFNQIDIKQDGSANATTSESWDFSYVSLNTGRELHKESYDLSIQYSMKSVNDKWLVEEVDIQTVAVDGKTKLNPFVSLPDDVVPVGMGLTLDELLKNTVLAYLKLLSDGYANQDMTPLFHSATKRRAMKAYHHMSSMGEGEVRMEPRLLEIEFPESRSVSDNSALVKTAEQWDYTYYSTKTGDEVFTNHVSYTLTYNLVKEGGNRWLVDDIAIEKMDEGEGKGKLPFFSRPHERIERSVE